MVFFQFFRIPVPIWLAIINILVAATPVLIGFLSNLFNLADLFRSGVSLLKSQGFTDAYDFIVIGGGSAGAVVASRLSENPIYSVLLIEAGDNPTPISLIPTAAGILSHDSTDWMYLTIPQKGAALASRNQQVKWPRGKMLGGSSGINFMMYNHGNPSDFDKWADISADNRWSYRNFRKYFLKLEDYYGYWDDGQGNGGNHSKVGPMRIEPPGYSPVVERILRAGEEFGLPTRDMSAGQGPGLAPIDFTIKRGRRFSTYRGYLQNVSKTRQNLKIVRYSVASKIHFEDDGGTPRAAGVFYSRHGIEVYAAAKKEIILSGGSIGSPQLLMLSGIGPKQHLQEIGIKAIIDSPVGQNLHDHVTTFVGPFLFSKEGSSFIPERDLTLKSIGEYLFYGTGPISVPAITSNGFYSTNKEAAYQNWPDISWIFGVSGITRLAPQFLNFLFNSEDIFDSYLAPHLGQDGMYLLQYLGKPKSTGYLTLRDKNPLSKPIINPNYYSSQKDIDSMTNGIEAIIQIVENSSSLGIELGAKFTSKSLPGCESLQFRSRQYWECWLRTLTTTIYHPAGTCKMAKNSDPSGVVTPTLNVKGVKSLRVVDASIMPRVTNANLNAPTIAIAEMASEMILEHWKAK